MGEEESRGREYKTNIEHGYLEHLTSHLSKMQRQIDKLVEDSNNASENNRLMQLKLDQLLGKTSEAWSSLVPILKKKVSDLGKTRLEVYSSTLSQSVLVN